MFTFEIKKIFIAFGITSSLMLSGCFAQSSTLENKVELKKNIDGAVIYPRENGKYNAYSINTQNIKNINNGRPATSNEIKAWDLDVMPDGTGLPEGQGLVEDGDELYSSQCAMCHGDFGSGGKGYPTLSGGQGSLKNQLLQAGDEPPVRTIGSYWPYASTLFWYVKSAMPFPHPKSLSNDEVYAITAYLLSINDITIDGVELDDEYVLDREKFLRIKMPNEDGFYPVSPERKDLKEQRVPLAQGTRCMKDCNAPKAVKIKNEITGFDPAISTVKDLPKTKDTSTSDTKNSAAAKNYEVSCSACHNNKVIGAPLFGDKDAWEEVMSKGISKVYENGLNGINAMPPKGGNIELSEKEFKDIVDYLINSSK